MCSTADHTVVLEKVAVDCEMMRSNIGQLLGRVSVVDYAGETIFDTFVCYPEFIKITNTDKPFSGIDWEDIDPHNGALMFSDVQIQLAKLFNGRTVIGHDIEKDLKVILKNINSRVQTRPEVCPHQNPVSFRMVVHDTQKFSGYRRYANARAHQGPNLKHLAWEILGRRIKQGPVSSIEDAEATMAIYRHAEMEIEREQGNKVVHYEV